MDIILDEETQIELKITELEEPRYSDEFLQKRVETKPFDEYDKEMKSSPRRTIMQYLSNPTIAPKNYVDIDIGFFGLCSYQPQAWDFVFKSIRDFYPNAPIVLINDGCQQFDYSEMAKKYNCIYVEKKDEIFFRYLPKLKSARILNSVPEAGAKPLWIWHFHNILIPIILYLGKWMVFRGEI